MNTSNITKSALALALGLCASGAWATVTNTNAFENFTSGFSGGINNVTQNGFTWTAGADAAAYSSVNGNGKLVVDTGDSVITGALASAQADDFTGKMAGHNAKFSAKVTFTPVAASATDPEIDTTNLKFALFAKDNGSSTNLYVVKSGSATGFDTGININARSNDSEKLVEVVFTANDTFTVAIDGGTPSSAYTFYSGTGINQVEFQGNGEVDDVGFTYELATPTITVTAAEHTSATLNGSAYTAPVTLTEGASYEVIFTADTGYEFPAGTTGTTVSGTVGTSAIAITGPAAVQSGFDEGDTPSIGGGTSHVLSADEADYLNDVVAAAITAGGDKATVETALASMTVDQFQQAALLNQDITDNDFVAGGSYSFGIKKIAKSGSTITVTVELTRSSDVLGGINGTLVLKTCATPTGTYTTARTLDIAGTQFASGVEVASADFSFTGVTDKFFKVVIE